MRNETNMQDIEAMPVSAETMKFRLITRLGEMILKHGGEIFRADEAMRYAAKAYGLHDYHAYVIANGIFSSCCTEEGIYSCRILSTPIAPVALCKVEALNDLARRISAGKCSLSEAEAELDRIENMSPAGNGLKLLAAAVGAGSFSMLFLGSFADGVCAAISGLFLELFFLYVLPPLRLPKIMVNIAGAFLAASVCCFLYTMGFGNNLDLMIIGPVFVLAPGISITNAIRNFMENDYLSGLLRMMDAILVAGSIAVGVGVSMQLWHVLTGGMLGL